MHARLLIALFCILPAAAASAAAPPRPVAPSVARINDDQVRGWEAVGKLFLGQRAMQLTLEHCKESVVLEIGPDQLGLIAAAAVGLPAAEIHDGIAAPGWLDFAAAKRLDSLLAGGACDADTASFISTELNGFVRLPAADLRSVQGLGKVPADHWPELVGMLREHQSLVFSHLDELYAMVMIARELGRSCPAAAGRNEAFTTRADAEAMRLVGYRAQEFADALESPEEARHAADLVHTRAAQMLVDFGGCDSGPFDDWFENTTGEFDAEVARASKYPPLTGKWLALARSGY